MASRNLGTLTLDLIARTGKFTSGFANAERTVDRSSKRMTGVLAELRKEIGKVSVGAALVGMIYKIGQQTIEAENSVRQLESRLKSTGGAAGVSSRELQSFAEELQGITTFADDAILGMQGVLLTFTSIRGDVFKDATRSILDLSVAMGQDLQSSAVQVGKALNDPIKGLTALQRVGVQFDASQKKLIENFVELGDVASAQRIILQELQKEFGGAATTAANTLGGSLTQLRNAFNNLFEAQTGVGTLTESIRELTALLQDQGTAAAFQTVSGLIIKAFTGILDTVVAVGKVINWFSENSDKMFIVPTIKAALREFQLIGSELEHIRDDIEFLEEQRDTFPWLSSPFLGIEEIQDRLGKKRLEEAREVYRLFGTPGPPQRLGPAKQRTPPGDEDAIEEIEKVRDALEQQIATFDRSAAAVMRYRIEQGDLAEAFKKARKEGEPLKDQIIAFAAIFESRQLRKGIDDQTKQLRDQAAVVGLNAEQTMRYRIVHGDLAETFKRIGESGRKAAADLIAYAKANERAANTKTITDMTKSLKDQIATFGFGEAAMIRYRIRQGDLTEAFENMGDKTDVTREKARKFADEIVNLTLQMQVMKDAAEGIDDAMSDMSESLNEGLDKFLSDFEERFLELRDVTLEFMQGLASGTENIIADALVSGFEGGAKGVLKSFGELMRQLIAEAVAADLAKRLFGEVAGGTGTGWIGAAAAIFGVKGKASGGPVMAGMPYLVGERGPEIIVPGRSSTVIPNGRIGGQTNYITLTVQTPTGRVPMETQQQMGNRLARALGDARRRNG